MLLKFYKIVPLILFVHLVYNTKAYSASGVEEELSGVPRSGVVMPSGADGEEGHPTMASGVVMPPAPAVEGSGVDALVASLGMGTDRDGINEYLKGVLRKAADPTLIFEQLLALLHPLTPLEIGALHPDVLMEVLGVLSALPENSRVEFLGLFGGAGIFSPTHRIFQGDHYKASEFLRRVARQPSDSWAGEARGVTAPAPAAAGGAGQLDPEGPKKHRKRNRRGKPAAQQQGLPQPQAAPQPQVQPSPQPAAARQAPQQPAAPKVAQAPAAAVIPPKGVAARQAGNPGGKKAKQKGKRRR